MDYPRITAEMNVEGFRAYVARAFSGFEPELKRAADEAIADALDHLDLREQALDAVRQMVRRGLESLKYEPAFQEILREALKAALLRGLEESK